MYVRDCKSKLSKAQTRHLRLEQSNMFQSSLLITFLPRITIFPLKITISAPKNIPLFPPKINFCSKNLPLFPPKINFCSKNLPLFPPEKRHFPSLLCIRLLEPPHTVPGGVVADANPGANPSQSFPKVAGISPVNGGFQWENHGKI